MGTSGNGDGWPENGLPDLPPGWGPIIIPDDPAALATESALLRRELRHQARQVRWRQHLGMGPDGSPLRLAVIIMTITVLATLASLTAFVWLGQQRSPTADRGTSGGTTGRTLGAPELVDEQGGTVPLRSLLPAVIILIGICDCAEQVNGAARAAPAGVNVVAVYGARPTPSPIPEQSPAPATPIRSLADPTDELRTSLRLTAEPGVPGVLLVTRAGEILRFLPAATSVADYQADLPRLATG